MALVCPWLVTVRIWLYWNKKTTDAFLKVQLADGFFPCSSQQTEGREAELTRLGMIQKPYQSGPAYRCSLFCWSLNKLVAPCDVCKLPSLWFAAPNCLPGVTASLFRNAAAGLCLILFTVYPPWKYEPFTLPVFLCNSKWSAWSVGEMVQDLANHKCVRDRQELTGLYSQKAAQWLRRWAYRSKIGSSNP